MSRNLRTWGKVMSPEVKYLAPGRPVMRFALVENNDSGTTWHSCVAWGDTALKMADTQEGDMIEVEAKVVTRSFVGKGGARRIVTENIVTAYKQLHHGKKEVR